MGREPIIHVVPSHANEIRQAQLYLFNWYGIDMSEPEPADIKIEIVRRPVPTYDYEGEMRLALADKRPYFRQFENRKRRW